MKNDRIMLVDASTHQKLKVLAAKNGMTMKRYLAILAEENQLERDADKIRRGGMRSVF